MIDGIAFYYCVFTKSKPDNKKMLTDYEVGEIFEINETAELLYEKNPQTGTIKVFEKGTNTKDRYVSAAMGSYFIDQLELDMIGNSSDYEYVTLCN